MSRTAKLSRPSLMPSFLGAASASAKVVGATAAAATAVVTVARNSLREVSMVMGIDDSQPAQGIQFVSHERLGAPNALWSAPAERSGDGAFGISNDHRKMLCAPA